MSGFLGIGGINSKQQNQAVGNLNNLFNFGMDTAKSGVAKGSSTTVAGLSGISDANSYFQKLASGNRAAMQQSQAPAINATLSQADAAKRNQAASGTARGGGTAGANQTANDSAMAKIDQALFGARPAAAAAEAQTSGKIADVGVQQTQEGLESAQIGGNASASAGNIATNARSQAAAEQQQIISDIFGFGEAFKSKQL